MISTASLADDFRDGSVFFAYFRHLPIIATNLKYGMSPWIDAGEYQNDAERQQRIQE
jgi:hypothetical protein